MLAQWNAVMPFPPWVALVVAAAFWIIWPRGSAGDESPGLSFFKLLVKLALVLGAVYAFARCQGLL